MRREPLPDFEYSVNEVRTSVFSVLMGTVILVSAACSSSVSDGEPSPGAEAAEPFSSCGTFFPRRQIMTMADPPAPTEIQGLVASRNHPNVLWVAESSDQGSRLVAISLDNERLGTWELGEAARTLVGLSVGPGAESGHDYLYAMIQRSAEPTRGSVQILQIPEPDPANLDSLETPVLEFVFPAEFSSARARASFVDPATGDLFIFVTRVTTSRSFLYRASTPITSDEPSNLELVASFSSGRRAITGAGISATGDGIVVRTDIGVSFWERPQGTSVPEAIVQPACNGLLRSQDRSESIAFRSDGSGLFTFSRDAPPILYSHELPEQLDTSQDGSTRIGNLSPIVAIAGPASDLQWRIGDELVLEAEVQDDGAVDKALLKWTATFFECDDPTECVSRARRTLRGESVLALNNVPALSALLRIEVTYTDEGGLSARDFVDLLPLASTINVLSTPPGLEVRANGVAQPTPFSFKAIIGDVLDLDAELQSLNGRLYTLASWLEKRAGTQDLEVLADTMTLTAQFEPLAPAVELDFSNVQIAPVASQDSDSVFSIEDGGRSLRITGNGWKQISLRYLITEQTILTFDFFSSSEGDIHGIKFAQSDDEPNSDRVLRVYGTQRTRRTGGEYSGSGIQTFIIPIGKFYTGEVVSIQFVNDHDIADPTAESVFSDVRIYELP